MKKTLFCLSLLLLTSSCNFVNRYNSYEDKELYRPIYDEGEIYNQSLKNIDIDWVSGSVVFKRSDEADGVSLVESSTGIQNDDEKAHIYRVDDKLYVKFMKSNKVYRNTMTKNLYVYVPYDYKLDNISVGLVSAKLEVSAVFADLFKASSVSGSINIDASNISKVVIDSVASDINVQATDTTKDVDIDSVNGNVVLSIDENIEGFKLKYDTVSGKFGSDFEYNFEEFLRGSGLTE